MGELHPRWQRKYELPLEPALFEVDVEAVRHVPLTRYLKVAKYPQVYLDLAFVFDASIEAQNLPDSIATACIDLTEMELIRDVAIFDEYRGKGLKDSEKSLAFRFRLQDAHQTLNDDTIESCCGI